MLKEKLSESDTKTDGCVLLIHLITVLSQEIVNCEKDSNLQPLMQRLT